MAANAAADAAQRALNEELWNAAKDGKLEVCKAAKEKGADPNWKHPWEPAGRGNQFTSLHIAADQKHVDVAKWLVDKGGADISISCPYGETALNHVKGLKACGEYSEITNFLKMKAAMRAALAAQKFKAMQAKAKAES